VCCALAAVAAAFVAGCGPIWSAAVIVDATGKFRTARDMDAKQYSPYEYYAAEEYLHKAREKESYAQYEQAVDYAKLALAYSKAAIEKSQHAKSGLVPAGPHPGLQSIFGGQGAQQSMQPQYKQTPAPQYLPPAQPQYAPPPAQPQYAPPPAPPAYAPPQYTPPAQPQYVPPPAPPASDFNQYTPPAP
jgi:hypothetical protein